MSTYPPGCLSHPNTGRPLRVGASPGFAMSLAVRTVTAPVPRGGIAGRTAVRLEIRCRVCGYGAVTPRRRLRCPMCGGDDWREGVNRSL
jgi:hypothetical protein